MIAHGLWGNVTFCLCQSQALAQFTGGTIVRMRRFHRSLAGSELLSMHIRRALHGAVFASSLLALTSCQTAPPPPPVVRPAAFAPLGVSAPYLSADVIGGRQARSAKMRAAKIRPLSPAAAGTYMGELDQELRSRPRASASTS